MPPISSPTNRLLTNDNQDLNKHRSALSQKLNKLKQSLEVTEQALQIETTGQDDQLLTLIGKWRNIARDATDELFLEAKERVDRMGGLTAWQRKVQEDKPRWDNDEGVGKHLCKEDDIDNQSEDVAQQTDKPEQDVGLVNPLALACLCTLICSNSLPWK